MSTVLLLAALGGGEKLTPGVGPAAEAQFTLKQVPDLRVNVIAPAASATFTAKQVPDLRVNAVAPSATAQFVAKQVPDLRIQATAPAATASLLALSKIDLTATGAAPLATASFTLEWAIKPVMSLEVLDPDLHRAPTALTVVVANALPDIDVTFDIDGTVVATATADSQGMVGPLSLNVSEDLGAVGSHTITAVQVGSYPATGAFTVETAPTPVPIVIGSDADPVDVPGAQTSTGVRRWVLQDLMPGGIGSWVMPYNPTSMTSPHAPKSLTPMHTTAITGSHHIFEGTLDPHEWQFSGYCNGKAMYDQLLAFDQIKRRFYVLDHRGRAWKVAFRSVDIRLRHRQPSADGTWNDWTGDYTVNALIYDERWWTPQ